MTSPTVAEAPQEVPCLAGSRGTIGVYSIRGLASPNRARAAARAHRPPGQRTLCAMACDSASTQTASHHG